MSMQTVFKASLLALTLPAALANQTPAEIHHQPTLEQLQALLEQQQQQIDALRREITQEEQDSTSQTSIGGYGELHYGHYDLKAPDGDAGVQEAFDLHRFVLFFGHTFDDNLRFFSELEVEHSLAGEGKKGEVELEQAYIEHQIGNDFHWKTGLFLLPIGLMNEIHEPNTFYGVERNAVESTIIPATWWEGGVAATYKVADILQVDAAITSGLKIKDRNFGIRDSRQKVSKANGEELAFTTRVKFTGITGLDLGVSAQYQQDITQSTDLDPAANAVEYENAPATLVSVHAAYSIAGFSARALYAQWNIESDIAETLGRDKQKGWYIEPSYRFPFDLGVFARVSAWDTAAGNNEKSERRSIQYGVNYWLHPNVVVKLDIERQRGNNDAAIIDGSKFNDKGFNLGVGYQF